MLVTTTDTLGNTEVREHLGIVTGETIVGAHIFKDIFASIRDIVGGRSGAYEKTLRKSRDIAIGELQQNAKKLGANAVIGLRFDYCVLGKTGTMMMVSVTGTAVIT